LHLNVIAYLLTSLLSYYFPTHTSVIQDSFKNAAKCPVKQVEPCYRKGESITAAVHHRTLVICRLHP